MSDRAPISLKVLHMMPGYLRAHGVDAREVFRSVGIADYGDDVIAARAQVCSALEETARRLGDPAVGMHLARALEPHRLGLTGVALFDGLTVADCLAGHARFMPALQGRMQFDLEIEDQTARWSHEFVGSEPESVRVLAEGGATLTVQALRAVIGDEATLLRVEFPHRNRGQGRALEEYFRAPVRFGVGTRTSLVFGSNLPNRFNIRRFAEAERAGLTRPGMDEGGTKPLSEADLADDHLDQALDLILDSMMAAGNVSMLRAAGFLGFSQRTLQRRLAARGHTFESVTDERRRHRAVELLANPANGIASIATLLGYSHPAHFVRAFHRWHGMSPSAYRTASKRA